MNSGNKHAHPTFIGIGSPRCGTTWLWKQLWLHHPKIWMPPLKEIHYFDHYCAPLLPDESTRQRSAIRHRTYRRHLRIRLQEYALLRFHNFNPNWDINYFCRSRNDDWYQSIFMPKSGQISGEITPNYAILDETVIRNIYKLNPELKLIFFMRDPIERMWSSVVTFLGDKQNRSVSTLSNEELFAFLQRARALKQGEYDKVIQQWEAVFQKDQFFYGFMDEVRENPHDLLLRIFEFLGVEDDSAFIPDSITKRVGFSQHDKNPIPAEIEAYLAERYLPMLVQLEERFGSPIDQWRKRAEAALGKG